MILFPINLKIGGNDSGDYVKREKKKNPDTAAAQWLRWVVSPNARYTEMSSMRMRFTKGHSNKN